MATSGSDTLYHSALHPRGFDVPERVEKAIRKRWQKWLPLAITFARSYGSAQVATRIDRFGLLHRQRCLDCLQRGLSWATIRRRNFDDPLCTEQFYRNRLQAALNRIANAKETNHERSVDANQYRVG